MNWNIIIPIIGVVIAAAVFMFGSGILRKSERKHILGKKQIFCGIEENELRIPTSLVEGLKNIPELGSTLKIFNIFLKNDSDVACMNPIITVKSRGNVFGYVINDTNEDRKEIEDSIKIAKRDFLYDLILTPKRLGANSFVDLTVWTDWSFALDERNVSFSSDSDFEIKTKLIRYFSNKERFD